MCELHEAARGGVAADVVRQQLNVVKVRIELPRIDGEPANVDLAIVRQPNGSALEDVTGNFTERRRRRRGIREDPLSVIREPTPILDRHRVQRGIPHDQQQTLMAAHRPAHAIQYLRQPQRDALSLDPGVGTRLTDAVEQRA